MKLLRTALLETETLGMLFDGLIPFCLTLERPWKGNQRRISCIPDGKYLCKRVQSPKFGNTFEVTDVPGRSHILFHAGNIADDTHGCILLGEKFGYLKGMPAVLSSGKTFRYFLNKHKDENEFYLLIRSL